MKILVTGANGQVGSCLSNALSIQGLDFLALTKEQLDIVDFDQVREALCRYKPDVVINAAAYTAVDKAELQMECAYSINSVGAKNLAVVSAQIGAPIFHISTDYVFSGTSGETYTEADPVDPQGIYGQSKLKGEQEVINANPCHIILRTAWVFGEHGNNFVKTMLRVGADRDELKIVNDQQGGPTYAGDIAKVLVDIATRYEKNRTFPWGIYHYSGFPHVSWFEFAQAIFNEVSDQAIYKKIPVLKPIATCEYPTPAKRPANSRLNCDKIQNVFGIKSSDWKAALKNIQAYS